jgi:hypothetical protein
LQVFNVEKLEVNFLKTTVKPNEREVNDNVAENTDWRAEVV